MPRARHAGERLDVFLAGARRLARRGAAADRRRARARRRRAAAQAPRARRRRGASTSTRQPEAGGAESRRRRFAVAYEDEHLLVIDKPAGRRRPSRRAGTGGTLVQALGRPRGRRRRPRAPGRRAPARPRHVRPARRSRARDAGRTRRCRRQLRAREITREYLALVEGRPPARARDDRRAAGPRPARADADLHRHRRSARRRSRTSRSSGAARATRCCACRWRPAARTRSARTCWRSAIPWPATPSTARAGRYGLERQFLHAARLAFEHPVDERGASSRSSPLPPTCRTPTLAQAALRPASGGSEPTHRR